MAETEDRLRDTLSAVALSVGESGEAAPEGVDVILPLAQPPAAVHPKGTRRRPLVVFAASFAGVLLAGAVSLLTSGSGDDLDGAGASSQSEEATVAPVESGLGMNGSHFAIDDQTWTLAEAWERSEGGPGTYSIYHRGTEQVHVLTGSATSHSSEFPGEGSTTLTMSSNPVTERSTALEVIFDWTTSDGMPVSVTFTGMDRDQALEVATTLRPIDSGEWAEMLEAARGQVEARTGESGTGGEEGTGEWIRLDAPNAPEVILELAEGIGLPPGHGFDRLIESLPEEPTEQTEEGIRSMLEFEAGCIWTGYWLDAVETSDTDARDRALAVLHQIPTWPALNATDGGGMVDAWTRNAELAAAGDVQGVLDNLYTANCTDVVPGN